MAGADQSAEGLGASLRRLVETLIAILQNRLELAGLELREAKFRLIQALMLVLVFFFLFVLFILLTILTFVVIFWESRVFILGGLAIFFLACAGIILVSLRNRMRNWPAPFSGTLAELKKDSECLSTRK